MADTQTAEQERLQESQERAADARVEALEQAEREAAVQHAVLDRSTELKSQYAEAASRADARFEQERQATEQAEQRARERRSKLGTELTVHQTQEIERVTANMPDGPEKDAKIAELTALSPTHTTEQIRYGGSVPEPEPVEPPPEGARRQAAPAQAGTPTPPKDPPKR